MSIPGQGCQPRMNLHKKDGPIPAPPFELPLIVSLSAATYLFLARYSLGGKEPQQTTRQSRRSGAHDAAMKSSKELTCASDLGLALVGGEAPQVTHFSFPSPSKVPVFTELASSSDVWNGEDPLTFLEEYQDVSAEEGIDGYIETSVSYDPSVPRLTHESQKKRESPKDERTVLHARSGSIQRGILMPHNEHWDTGPILTLIPDLPRLEILR